MRSWLTHVEEIHEFLHKSILQWPVNRGLATQIKIILIGIVVFTEDSVCESWLGSI